MAHKPTRFPSLPGQQHNRAPDPESKRSQKKRLRAEQARLSEQESAVETDRATENASDEPEGGIGVDDEGEKSMQDTSAIIENDSLRPLKVGETIVDRLPDVLAKVDDCLYPDSTATWHAQSGGRDTPPSDLLGVKRVTVTRANVMMTFRQSEKIMFTAGALKGIPVQNDGGDGNAAGPTPAEAAAAATESKLKTKETLGSYHPVKVSWIMNSQVPGFTLSVIRRAPRRGDREGDNEPVTVHLHVNNMVVRKDDRTTNPRVCLVSGFGNEITQRLDPSSGLEAESKSSSTGCLWSTEVKVWRTGYPSTNPDLTNAEPTFSNISKDDLVIIRSAGDSAEHGDLSALSIGDWVLYGLMTCTSFGMYRTWSKDPESMEIYDFFTRYMRTLLNEVALMGNFPFYARQAHQQLTTLHSEHFKIHDAIPPRNMVTSWRVRSEDNKRVSAVAETWTSFTPLDAYSESRAKTFAMRLGIARTRTYELAAVQESIDRFMGKIRCLFMKLSHVQVGTYYGEIFLSNNKGKLFGENGVKSPVPNTRIIMKVIDGQFAGKKFAGVVVPDVYGRGRDVCVSVCVQQGHAEFPLHFAEVEVEIEFKDDTTSCDRQDAAITQLGRGTQRTYGVDFQSVLLETPSVICNTGSIAEEVKDYTTANEEWDGALEHFKFTPEQEIALDMSFTSSSGLTIVHGPPGTGKTFTQMAGMMAHICVGKLADLQPRTVLATAPTNTAVDNNLKIFIDIAKKAGKDLQICRFRGGAPSPYMNDMRSDNATIKEALSSLQRGGKQPHGTAGESDDNAYSVWESIDATSKSNTRIGAGLIPEYEFNAQRKAFVMKIGRDKTSPDMQDARHYLYLRRDWRHATGNEKKELREQVDKLDKVWNQRYFDQVDIVFVTNSTAAHPLLALHFKPRILASDEVGQAALADQAIPAAAFIDSLELFWATGDPKQQGPHPLVEGSNEAIGDLSKSPFDILFGNKSIAERIMLLEQNRMRPVISGMVSRLWYDGKLKDGESVLSVSPLELTILDAYEKLKPHWNGSTRMMVDVSGPNVLSECYGDWTSLYNRAEADLLLDHIEFLLNFVPPQAEGEPIRRRIAQKDILIITAYSGQTIYLIAELWRRKINNVGVGEVRVTQVRIMTSGSVQGIEAPIVLHSMVRNEPGNPFSMGFTRKTDQLCVNFSRAQIHHVTFGNVKALMHGKTGGHKMFAKGGMLSMLGNIIQDFYDKREVLSGERLSALHQSGE